LPKKAIAFMKFYRTPQLEWQIFNKTNIDNSCLLIKGYSSLQRFKGILFYGHVPVSYRHKRIKPKVRSDGKFVVKSKTLWTIHDASLDGYIKLTLNNPCIAKKGGPAHLDGKTSWYIYYRYGLEIPAKQNFFLHQSDMKLYVDPNFEAEIQTLIPENVRCEYGEAVKFRYVIASAENRSSMVFPEWDSIFSFIEKYTADLFCDLTVRIEENTSCENNMEILALIPEKPDDIAEYAYLSMQMKSTLGGHDTYVVWCSSSIKHSCEKMKLCVVNLNSEVLSEIRKNITFHSQRIQLSEAIKNGDAGTCRKLFKEGISPNCLDDVGYPFLVRAAQKGDNEVMNAFLDNGADKTVLEEFMK
jgi:hypothetical protein